MENRRTENLPLNYHVLSIEVVFVIYSVQNKESD